MMEESTRRRHKTNKKPQLVVSSGTDDASPTKEGMILTTKTTRKRRRRRKTNEEPPFYMLVCQVGTTLLLVCLATWSLYRHIWPASLESAVVAYDDDDGGQNSHSNSYDAAEQDAINNSELKLAKLRLAMEEAEAKEAAAQLPKTPPPLPIFELSEASKWDAFGIEQKLLEGMNLLDTTSSLSSLAFWKAAKGLRHRFAENYGGDNAARMLLDKGMTTFSKNASDIAATACRFQNAKQNQRPFRLTFGGYSVTAGRGNKFDQSFPFQLERYLRTVVKLAGIPELQVHNAAIGGCPAFPYGWCMTNFWGHAPDVVSWDYSMNEAGGVPEGLEAYVRHVLSTYSKNPPKLIVKDTYLASQRRNLLGEYASWNLLPDPVVIHTDPAVKPFLDNSRPEEFRPVGFQDWRKFGAPLGAPGQALHHPALKEHELIGWMLAMHFLSALEYMVGKGDDLQCPTIQPRTTLPPPVTGRNTANQNDKENTATTTVYEDILFGHPKQSNPQEWVMNPVHCRTTFQPIQSGDLSELVVSGSMAENLDVLLPKSQMFYNQGWTLDLSENEKTARRKLSLYDNQLGFVDSKEAYYGIYESPKMQMFVPYAVQDDDSIKEEQLQLSPPPKVGQPAADWFERIVLCQVNEKREATACNFGSDVGVLVGGANATDAEHKSMMKDAGTLYLGKQVCMQIRIPADATLTSHNQLTRSDQLTVDQVGLLVEVYVTNSHIAHVNQACSISHVVWEEKRDA